MEECKATLLSLRAIFTAPHTGSLNPTKPTTSLTTTNAYNDSSRVSIEPIITKYKTAKHIT